MISIYLACVSKGVDARFLTGLQYLAAQRGKNWACPIRVECLQVGGPTARVPDQILGGFRCTI